MTDQHPITPPIELVREWAQIDGEKDLERFWLRLATQAARWGADQELEACCKWVDTPINYEDCRPGEESEQLRAARRLKPPSLKEQALETLSRISKDEYPCSYQDDKDWETIRRALEQLDD